MHLLSIGEGAQRKTSQQIKRRIISEIGKGMTENGHFVGLTGDQILISTSANEGIKHSENKKIWDIILRIIESKGKKTDKISYELKGSFLYSPEKVTPTIFDGLPSRIIEFDTKGNYKNIRGASI